MKLNKTKIVATVGPACSSRAMLKRLVAAGVDVFRINFSHSTHDEAKKIVKDIRRLNKELKVHISILGDLQGPKIRIGQIPESLNLSTGDPIILTTKNKNVTENNNSVPINYSAFASDVDNNEKILINDGKLILKVVHTNKKDTVKAKVIQGGLLEPNKGVNLPNTRISMPALTKKDKEDVLFAIKNSFDWIAFLLSRNKGHYT